MDIGWKDVANAKRDCISRLEIIDENGRAYTRHELYIELASLQDDGCTLKLFVRPRKGNYAAPQASDEAQPEEGRRPVGQSEPSKPHRPNPMQEDIQGFTIRQD